MVQGRVDSWSVWRIARALVPCSRFPTRNSAAATRPRGNIGPKSRSLTRSDGVVSRRAIHFESAERVYARHEICLSVQTILLFMFYWRSTPNAAVRSDLDSLLPLQVPIAARVLTDSEPSSQLDLGIVLQQDVDHNAVHRPVPRHAGQICRQVRRRRRV